MGAWDVVWIRLNWILNFYKKFQSSSTNAGVGVVRCENDFPKPVAFGLCV